MFGQIRKSILLRIVSSVIFGFVAIAAVYVLILSGLSVFLDWPLSEFIERYLNGIISSFAVLTSALSAGIFAHISINSARETSKLQKTLEFITSSQLDEQYIRSKEVWKKYRQIDPEVPDDEMARLFAAFYRRLIYARLDRQIRNGAYRDSDHQSELERERTSLRSFCETNHDAAKRSDEEGQLVMLYLNHFELLSLAIHSDSLDDKFYNGWHGTLVVTTWNASLSAIGALRCIQNNEQLFKEWESRALVWSAQRKMTVLQPPRYDVRRLAELALQYSKRK